MQIYAELSSSKIKNYIKWFSLMILCILFLNLTISIKWKIVLFAITFGLYSYNYFIQKQSANLIAIHQSPDKGVNQWLVYFSKKNLKRLKPEVFKLTTECHHVQYSPFAISLSFNWIGTPKKNTSRLSKTWVIYRDQVSKDDWRRLTILYRFNGFN